MTMRALCTSRRATALKTGEPEGVCPRTVESDATITPFRELTLSGSPKNSLMKLIAAVLIIGLGVVIAAATGGLDMAVLSEAPKSLTYRLEYWQSTLATIREQPWLGTGPGNFRDHYLKHKLPASSEEIADPHNLMLDVWANAGTIGLIGLLLCIALMAKTWLRPISES